MDTGKYYVARDGENVFFRLSGYLKYTISTGFDSYLDILFHEGFNDVLIDLSDAKYIDSTNLGLLARLAEYSIARKGHKPTIIVDSNDIRNILESVCFDKVFVIVGNPHFEAEIEEFEPIGEKSAYDLSKTMIKAHKALMRLDKTNEKRFNEVVELMEKCSGQD